MQKLARSLGCHLIEKNWAIDIALGGGASNSGCLSRLRALLQECCASSPCILHLRRLKAEVCNNKQK